MAASPPPRQDSHELQNCKAGACHHHATYNTVGEITHSREGRCGQGNPFASSLFIDTFFTNTLVHGAQNKLLRHTEAQQTHLQGKHRAQTQHTSSGAIRTHYSGGANQNPLLQPWGNPEPVAPPAGQSRTRSLRWGLAPRAGTPT